jgi:hypothetical protein
MFLAEMERVEPGGATDRHVHIVHVLVRLWARRGRALPCLA